ncbi:MAG: helix-turn-helix domain-containing protein [Spirochaetia bacterium]|nr:helix-turn-helix domain-containing protein [Spirochaetia bacterium]
MVLTKRVGSILKEAREGRKLTIKEVARDTNITPRYVEALENEDYTQFPGETYTLGFLRTYSDYLGLDTEQIINLYRGLQIDQTQTPLKELTRQGYSLPSIGGRNVMIAGGVLGAILLVILVITSGIFRGAGSGLSSDDDASCKGREVVSVTIPQQGAPARVENLSQQNALKMAVDSGNIKICLNQVKKNPQGPPVVFFDVRINDESNYSFRAAEGEAVTLGPSLREFSSFAREIKITPRGAGDVSARIQIESGESVKTADNKTAGAGEIQVTLQFVNDSYFEWTDDGNVHTGLQLAGGETRTLEAKNRLEIKVGDAGSVRIMRDGYPAKMAGPPGRIAKIVYKKVPDPLDPGVHKVVEAVEVAQ